MNNIYSLLNLNGDRSLRWHEKLVYIFVNWCRNIVGDLSRLQCLGKFKPVAALKKEDYVSYDVSPSRRLSDYFWMSVDYGALVKVLNAKVRVFDIGCGSGRYYKILGRELGDKMESYKGLDLSRRDEWRAIEENFDNTVFVADDAKNSSEHLTDENMVISQSALEHIEHDEEAIVRVSTILCEKEYPSIQIHLVPASHSLFSYLFHGFRQYNKRRLKKIIMKLEEQPGVRCEVYALGGWRCLVTHLKWFTIPQKRAILEYDSTERDKYAAECKNAVRRDCMSNSVFSPDFYALIVYTGVTENIRLQ